MRKIDSGLHERLNTIISSMGCELVGCEMLPQGGHMLFRIYIDSETGVTSDNCAQISRQISAMMDVEDPIQGRYTLEVSSPGIDRPLFELKHFQRFTGSVVKMRLHLPIDGRRQFKGVLQRVEGEDIYLLVEDSGQELKLPFSSIEKANVIGDTGLVSLPKG